MASKLAALMIAALTSLACASPERTVYAENTVIGETEEAATLWNEALAKRCPDVRLVLVYQREGADISVALADPPADLAGAERDGRIRIDPQKAARHPEMVAPWVAHELGHAFGLPDGWHSKDPADLMYAPVPMGRSPEPTAADAAAVCVLWGE